MQYGIPYIKAIKMQKGIDISKQAKQYDKSSAILADSYVEGIAGGTGRTFNWDLIKGEKSKPVILAGGLTPENVIDAVKAVKPYAVDVSSGVESGLGIKDTDKVIKFIKCIQENIYE